MRQRNLSVRKLKAKFKHGLSYYRESFNSAKVILAISVGQKYHEGEKFEATIDLVNRSKFEQCSIMVADSLQRYNLCIDGGDDIETAHIEANKWGDEWLKRNFAIYSRLQMPYEIIRWDTWLNHPDYKKHREAVNYLYDHDEDYRQAFARSIDKFLTRYQKHAQELGRKQIDYEKAFKLCLEYLQEECAIMMPLWASYAYDFIVYPSKMPDAVLATHDKFVKPINPNLLVRLSLAFKR